MTRRFVVRLSTDELALLRVALYWLERRDEDDAERAAAVEELRPRLGRDIPYRRRRERRARRRYNKQGEREVRETLRPLAEQEIARIWNKSNAGR